MDGLKTGYTAEAGFCITATANINNMRIITVVMGEPDSKTRNADVSAIFDYVYAQYALTKVVSTDTILEEADVEKGKNKTVGIVAKEDVADLYKKSDGENKIEYDIQLNSLKAPITKGEVVGKLTLKENGIETRTIDLTVSEDVKKANIIELYIRYLKDVLG